MKVTYRLDLIWRDDSGIDWTKTQWFEAHEAGVAHRTALQCRTNTSWAGPEATLIDVRLGTYHDGHRQADLPERDATPRQTGHEARTAASKVARSIGHIIDHHAHAQPF